MRSLSDQEVPGNVDVAVIGSGMAGLTAALSAARAGARVLLLERSQKIGGTTAYSGGMLWIPVNTQMKARGLDDSVGAARQYLTAFGLGRVPAELVETYLETGPRVIEFIESSSSATFSCRPSLCDYREEVPGWHRGGRSLEPGPVPIGILGALGGAVRESVHFGEYSRFSFDEAREFSLRAAPDQALIEEALQERRVEGLWARGRGLVISLLAALLDAGATVVTGARATELVVQGGAVRGVVVESSRGRQVVRAARGVVLACGGYEWDLRLRRLLPAAPIEGAPSPPYNDGDNLRLATMAGAELRRLDEAWWSPLLRQDGEQHDGAPLYRLTNLERGLPGSICVNTEGRRFTNEAINYNDFGRAMFTNDPLDYRRRTANRIIWLVFDNGFKNRYTVGTVPPTEPAPNWIRQAASVGELAASISVPEGALETTVARFNEMAREGVDEDFGRGSTTYNRCYGDATHLPNPNLAPLEDGPYYAVRLYLGAFGTNGGPATDTRARVLDLDGRPVPGLFACGNASAGVMTSYPGGGGTLGPAAVFGYLAGTTAAAG